MHFYHALVGVWQVVLDDLSHDTAICEVSIQVFLSL